MEFCVSADDLRKALAEIERAEANGFNHCLAVFKLTSAGDMLYHCRASYSDLMERASESPAHNWGRFQGVTKRNRFVAGKLVPIKDEVT